MIKLSKNEIEDLRHAPGQIADGGETTPSLWELERRGLLRPVYSYNPAHYRIQNSTVCDFSEPKFSYTRTEFGEEVNAYFRDLERMEVPNV